MKYTIWSAVVLLPSLLVAVSAQSETWRTKVNV